MFVVEGGMGATLAEGADCTVKIYVLEGHQRERTHNVGRLGIPRKSSDAGSRTASEVKAVWSIKLGEGE